VLPEYARIYTEPIPLHVLAATGYATETSLLSPPLNEITEEAMIVSSPQLDTAEMVTVYLPLPVEQFVTRLKMPMLSPPAVAVDVLKSGVVIRAHPVELPPPPPPLPPLPRCANKGRASNARQTNTNVGLIKFFMLPPRRIELS